ncbi:MAG: amidohydrolase [Alphaproteobacteria bacterium]|nr:amidohydrolase [Alphaproteobacteria bacterium]
MRQRWDQDGSLLPIKIDATSNGEFVPVRLDRTSDLANRHALTVADANARHSARARRAFLRSASGAATTLLALNEVQAAAGRRGGFYEIPAEAALDQQLAQATVGAKKEFIFDVQGHHIGDLSSWREDSVLYPDRMGFRFFAPHSNCTYKLPDPEVGHLNCLTGDAFVKEVFMDSDTDIAVLSFGPARENTLMPKYSEGARTRDTVAALKSTKRLLLHGRCMPTFDGDLAAMEEVAKTWNICAWKTYTQFGPNETGFWLDGDLAAKFYDNMRKTGVKVLAVHKGLPFPNMGRKNLKYKLPSDVGAAAKANPDITFLIYHSGYDPVTPEGAYEQGSGTGVDTLIDSLTAAGITPANNTNVYAELGSTWRFLMRNPDESAHVLGKLLKYVGVDRVLWGTDSIWYGSPQDQIQALRTFQISDEFQEKFGYPRLTDDIRAKIFGLNAAPVYGITPAEIKKAIARDVIEFARNEYRNEPDPSHITYGPRNRREFMRFKRYEASQD